MSENKDCTSPSQVMEEQIDAPDNLPSLLNGLNTKSTLEKEHPPALKIGGRRYSLPPTVIGSGSQQFNIPATLQTLDDHRYFTIPTTLLDSGVTDVGVIDSTFVDSQGINTVPVAKPITTANADGSPNADGVIKHYVPFRMKVGSHEETINLLVTKLSSNQVFLSHEWLSLHDPEISWRKKTL